MSGKNPLRFVKAFCAWRSPNRSVVDYATANYASLRQPVTRAIFCALIENVLKESEITLARTHLRIEFNPTPEQRRGIDSCNCA